VTVTPGVTGTAAIENGRHRNLDRAPPGPTRRTPAASDPPKIHRAHVNLKTQSGIVNVSSERERQNLRFIQLSRHLPDFRTDWQERSNRTEKQTYRPAGNLGISHCEINSAHLRFAFLAARTLCGLNVSMPHPHDIGTASPKKL
jgi:hypothetical protein